MLSVGMVRNIFFLLSAGCLLMIDGVIGVPVPQREEKDLTLVPINIPATRYNKNYIISDLYGIFNWRNTIYCDIV